MCSFGFAHLLTLATSRESKGGFAPNPFCVELEKKESFGKKHHVRQKKKTVRHWDSNPGLFVAGRVS